MIKHIMNHIVTNETNVRRDYHVVAETNVFCVRRKCIRLEETMLAHTMKYMVFFQKNSMMVAISMKQAV